MEPNVQNFLKNFTEPKGTSVSANSNPANVNTLNSQNSVPNQLINTQSDFANIWNTWSPYVATSPGASKESSLLTGNVSGTGTNEKNTKANDEIQRTVEDLLDLNFDEITDMALSAAPILKEISPVETVNLAVGTPVEISDLFKGAANVFKDATHVQKDNVNAPKSITNVSYGNTSASQDIVCAIKDTMNVPKSIQNSSSDKASSIKDISCAKKDSVNAPNLKNALKDILNVHRDIQAKNNEASCEKNPEIQIKSLPKQGFENQIKSLPKQGFENQIKSLPKQGFENQIKSLPKKENKSPAKTLSNNIASVSDSCDMDRKLKCQLEEKKFTAEYQEFQKIRQALPIYHKKDTIVDLIERSKVVVISGPTGCGKTTQVPQYILDSEIFKGRGSNCRIVCTQPRRISAVSVAQRIAEERCEEVGNEECSVGYQVRLEKQVPRVYGSILLCTPGILLQNMHKDPELQGISHLLMDEIHERDITSDLFMAVMKELTIKRNIKVVLMSATMNSHLFSKYFGDCPMLDIPGSMYPVKVHFLEDILTVIKPNSQIVQTPKPTGRRGPTLGRSNNQYNNKKTEYAIMMKQYVERLTRSKEYPNNVIQQLMDFKVEFLSIENIFALIKHICFERKIPGAILVFLPGWDNITSLDNMMDESGLFRDDEFLIITLHSTTPIQRQQMAFTTPPEGVRKIVLATNIAETSITIDDIVFVIDCGLSKVKRFDARKNITTLDTEFISKANLLQRRGRAGRLREGECYHFISKIRDQRLKLEPDPEIRRSRIEDVIIKCKLLPLGKTQDFLEKLLNPPPADNIKASIDTLVEAQVLDANEELTPLGRLVALLPVDHFLAKMIILGAFFRCLDPILSIASSLSLKDPFVLQTKKRKQLLDDKKTELDRKRYSDHILISEVMQLWDEAVANNCSETVCRDNFLSETTFEFLSAVKQQLADCLYEMKFIPGSNMLNYLDENLNVNSQNIAVLRAVICAALYPNVVNVKDEMVTMNNQKVPVLETFEDKQVYLGFRSVNCKVQVFPSKFLVYFAKQSSSNKVYIHDSTMVTLSSLVLFANRVQQSFPPYVIIKNIPYDMSRNRDILTLRDNFHKAFRDFTENPRLIPFDSNEEHNIVVSQIVKLLTKEEENMKRM